ncbi:hypothetical protein [Roseimaritima ulvae]|uniref:hypothetical protein n=1 Tax=Roseimaritima ulvae TaxID=980254 RepID=UPI0012FAAC73|nr:hypothetical protein [Roseimaritima ulvae]
MAVTRFRENNIAGRHRVDTDVPRLRTAPINSKRQPRTVAALIAFVAFVSIILHNAATFETFEPASANAVHGTVEYGWPFTCYTGSISVERMFYATSPRQHWASTSSGSLAPIGFSVDAAVALLLTWVTYQGLVWTFSAFNAKLSIATLLGFLAYTALLFAFEVADNAKHYEMFPRLRELFLEMHIFEYIEKAVWVTLFIACLWLPNRSRMFCKTARSGEQ